MTVPYIGPGSNPTDWVTRHYPGPLRAALEQRGGVPHSARSIVARQLSMRSAEQLRERIERRWYQRYAHLTGPVLLARADEIAEMLVAAPDCEVSDRCEDGWLLDEEANCTWCRPSRTEFDLTGQDETEGRRASPDTVARMAGSIRAQLREGRRSVRAATERARVERIARAEREQGRAAGYPSHPGRTSPDS
ncbi:hypothetical protein AB0K43_18745 [Kitasatospora sp. NPDC049258]|uniref:hypothetical protein n=1 Tax=Kitasatospora sp. NPDC049258 TaxID=3155394 RepID=UPI0034282087